MFFSSLKFCEINLTDILNLPNRTEVWFKEYKRKHVQTCQICNYISDNVVKYSVWHCKRMIKDEDCVSAFYLLLPSSRCIVWRQHCHFRGSPGATYNRRLARRSGANEVVRGVQCCGWWEGLSGSQWRGYVCDQWSMMGDHPAQQALRPGMATPPRPDQRADPLILWRLLKKNAQSLKSKQKTRTIITSSSRAVLSNIKKKKK